MKLLFSMSFRPLFLGAFIYAPYVVVLWVLQLQGIVPLMADQPIMWHAHEMIYGFVAAGIGGFLFTAVANWTGRAHVQGVELMLLVASWVIGRCLMHSGDFFADEIVMLGDLAYLSLVVILLGRELIMSSNRRNYVVLAIILMFWGFNLAYHLEITGRIPPGLWSVRGSLMTIILLIALIGGRITPAFTRNWLRQRGESQRLPVESNLFDQLVMATTFVTVPLWTFLPFHILTHLVLILCGVLHGLRVTRWCGLATLSEPLLLILHVAYWWIALGMLLLGLSGMLGIPTTAGVHALTLGAITTMLSAVGTRAAMGHSGRVPRATPLLTAGFICIFCAALFRIALVYYGSLLFWAAGFWVAGFICLFLGTWEALLKPRIEVGGSK